MSETPPNPWFRASVPPETHPFGVVVLVHGLNNRPSVMQPLAEALAEQGFHSYTVTLTGHSVCDWPAVDYAATWKADIRAAAADARMTFPGLPVFALAYSLGATAVLESWDDAKPFDRLAFLAPAFAPNLRTRLLRFLTPLRVFGINLPSLADPFYRAHPSTPLRAYRGYFDMIDNLRKSCPHATWRSTPSLVFMSEKDELLSYDDTSEWIQRSTSEHWSIAPLTPRPANPKTMRHLILDQASVGTEEWRALVKELADFFRRARN